MRITVPFALSAVILGGVITVGCTRAPSTHEVTPALREILAGQPPASVEPSVWTDLRAFYTQRAEEPAWVNRRRPTEHAAAAINALNTARQHGFSPDDYGTGDLLALSEAVEGIDKKSPERLKRVAEFDVRMSAALLAFGRDVAVGRTTPKIADGSWKVRRIAPEYVATFANAIDDPLAWIESLRPPHAEYADLQKALDDLHGQQEKGGWTTVPPGVMRIGSAGAGVVALRRRLAESGQLKPASEGANGSARFDSEVDEAVKAFQELHGMKSTGVVDLATTKALNVTLEERMRQVALNLQRWRWMPDDLGARHFIVNIPHFMLEARENNQAVMDIRVVVGKPGHNTPIFSEEMETVVLSPYWNIPDSIAEGETVPAMARDPNYLAKQNIEVLRVSGGKTEIVNPKDVNWDDTGDATKGLVFRQRPGASNALGHVKFLFPNRYNVYLHDTPADTLFAKPGRAFSHGCVRVEEPEKLAKYVLRDRPEWDEAKLFAAMKSGTEKHVRLTEKIPVHFVYFTAWVENGGLHFQPDIYGYDKQ